MTGAYLRIKRDGKWQTIEVEYLTPEELREAMDGRSAEELIRWIELLSAAVLASAGHEREVATLGERIDRLNFALNTLRLDLGIDPAIGNTETVKLVAAFQAAMAALNRALEQARGHNQGRPPGVAADEPNPYN